MNFIIKHHKLKKADIMNLKKKENMEHLCSKVMQGDCEPTCESKQSNSTLTKSELETQILKK